MPSESPYFRPRQIYAILLPLLWTCLSTFGPVPGSLLWGQAPPLPPHKLELRPGDHICIIGNTLAERMQHDGWLETFIHDRFPGQELVYRNLGFSGDELTLRLRSKGFGSPDEHLTSHEADVIFAFFGFNESFAGEAGLESFTENLRTFVRDTLSKKYNGTSAPRLVLFSPIAHEDLGDRNLPDGRSNNRRIRLYTDAMADVAAAEGVFFVDLFRATESLYQDSEEALTINGIHLNERGNKLLASVIEHALFPGESPTRDSSRVERLRSAVLEKNFYWYHRYRVTDGYSVYGGRSYLKFVDGQTNREVMDREFEMLDVMTANRDRRIWAVARGGDLEVDDSNVPAPVPVQSNKLGDGPGGAHRFLGGEEAISKMTVGEGLEVRLFASEEQFPQLANPVQMAFDTKGRLCVAVMPSYPHWRPTDKMDDKVLIFEDPDGDGHADECKVFADELHVPTGLEFYGGGLLVGQQPTLTFLKDTDGDDKVDFRERVVHGIDSADTHHAMNSFVLDPGGGLYFQEGVFHRTQVETLWGPQRCADAGVFRYEPRTHKFEVYATYGFANPHGHVFDRWGQDIVTDGTGARSYFGTAMSGYMEYPQKHARLSTVYRQRTRPCPGTEILSSRHFPEEFQGNFLVANVIGFQGILRYRIYDEDSGFGAEELEPILFSSDPNFRPVDIETGPDGAIYFVDWQNPLIGHMQHNLRDPSRDATHGRIYRVTRRGRPLLQAKKIAGEPIATLVELLKEPEDRVRYRAKIELSARDSEAVLAAAEEWMAGLDRDDKDYEHHVMEVLWLHQYHNVVNESLLRRMLRSPEFRARAAATRVLCHWRDRVPASLELLRKLAADEHPRVRLEAVRAASFFKTAAALDVALISTDHPTDYYIDYTRGETMKTLKPYWHLALAEGRLALPSGVAARLVFAHLTLDEVLQLERTSDVNLELLSRPGVSQATRHEAVRALAASSDESETGIVLGAIRRLDAVEGADDTGTLYDLARLLTLVEAQNDDSGPSELAAREASAIELATKGLRPITRRIGFAALVSADAGGEKAWELASASISGLEDLVGAVPLIVDPEHRVKLYPRLRLLLRGVPGSLNGALEASGAGRGRFVRIEIPDRRARLRLAEVQVYSDGVNVALGGAASQSSTVEGGVASRAIDGNVSGDWEDEGQSQTDRENDVWWEVDLGREHLIDSVTVYNNEEKASYLRGFSLKILDAERNVTFLKEGIPAPEVKADFDAGGPAGAIRRATMNALTYIPGREADVVRLLADFVREDVDRRSAVRSLQRIPQRHWPHDQSGPLLDLIVPRLAATPARERTSVAFLETLEFCDTAAGLLPPEEARRVRAQLSELGVRVVRIGTVPHQMLYDRDRIVLAAGEEVELLFENTDIMPHNLVVTQIGTLEEIGLAAEAMATGPEAVERHYVPRSKKILLSSRLLYPNESQKLRFQAPQEPGVYPYVCTFPGHWRRMFGALYVVENLEDYLVDPEAYLVSHPLEVVDEPLKSQRPQEDWKFEDLVGLVDKLEHGRSHARAKQTFRVANCVACHRVEGVGTELGPDLTKLDPKLTPAEILRDVLEPSWRIHEKFSAYTFVMTNGRVVSGLVLKETPTLVHVVENPLARAEPRELQRSEILRREKSPVSTMPEGLLDRLTAEEILDLLAYLVARGDRNHGIFSGSCGIEAERR